MRSAVALLVAAGALLSAAASGGAVGESGLSAQHGQNLRKAAGRNAVNPFGSGPADPHGHKKIPSWAKGLAKYAAAKKAAIADKKEGEEAGGLRGNLTAAGNRTSANETKASARHQKEIERQVAEREMRLRKKAEKAWQDDFVSDGNGLEDGHPTPGYGSMKVRFSHAHAEHDGAGRREQHHAGMIVVMLSASLAVCALAKA